MKYVGKIIVGLSLMFSVAVAGSTASAMTVTGLSQGMTVADKTVMTSDQLGNKIKFVAKGNVLHLMSGDGTEDFLTFGSFDGIYTNVNYNVRAIETTDPAKRLFEITATRGASEKSCGYWLVGQQDGSWTTYVSWNSLANIGFYTNQWHRLVSTIENQQIVLTSYDRYNHVDFKTQIFWDDNSDWFGLRRY